MGSPSSGPSSGRLLFETQGALKAITCQAPAATNTAGNGGSSSGASGSAGSNMASSGPSSGK